MCFHWRICILEKYLKWRKQVSADARVLVEMAELMDSHANNTDSTNDVGELNVTGSPATSTSMVLPTTK
jgi:hypothetical protein